ncbi:Hypothetical predicted protein [Mytilus galloprovincialis]|uniref:Uncharacterized protein n=1 Tax=Mytilus galloprovincialis TaxID=29158 RepID=A0A8B6BKJ7_MYTGA|nr:Hypothetical predicted protein [Mytilus galloprovincialis]
MSISKIVKFDELEFYRHNYVSFSATTQTTLKSTLTHPTTRKPRPTPEPQLYDDIYFTYSKWSAEHLLIAWFHHKDCYAMPLSETDIQTIQTTDGLTKFEIFMLGQIRSNNYYLWSADDLEVRNQSWGKQCRNAGGKVYRVYAV